MIELNKLGYRWPDSKNGLVDLSFKIAPGEKVVLLGANGCGKSTLLKLMNGLVFADTGELRWQGETLTRARLKDRTLARSFRRACVLLFQHPEAMLFNPSVRDEIAYGLRQLGGAEAHEIAATVERWAAELGLTAQLDKPPFLLSGGEKQKLALACLLALDPQLLLLDEPSASLDPATVGWLVDTLVHSDKTVVVSTHNLSMAAELGERCIMLGQQGQMLFDGPMSMALSGVALLEQAGLAHRHRHRHKGVLHAHAHVHDWDKRS